MTASDPTELIREASEALADRDRLVGNMGMLAVSLVRRLRDELRAEQKDFEVIANALDEERAYSAHLKGEVSRAKEWLGVNAATRFAEFREAQRWAEWFAAERDYIRAIRRDDLDYCERTTAALAEAKATIERVKALCDDKSAGPLYEAAVRRALDPPDAHEQCPECGGWDGFHAYIIRSVAGGEGEMAYGGMVSSPCPRRAIEEEQA